MQVKYVSAMVTKLRKYAHYVYNKSTQM